MTELSNACDKYCDRNTRLKCSLLFPLVPWIMGWRRERGQLQ